MLSFRVEDREAEEAQRWASALGIDRSELLREALRRHLDRLASEGDAERLACGASRRVGTGVGGDRGSRDRPRTGRIGLLMQRGEIWFAATPGGDRPVLVLTRDPVVDRIGVYRGRGFDSDATRPGVGTRTDDRILGAECGRREFRERAHDRGVTGSRRRVTALWLARMADACRGLQAATGC